jgi:cell division protein FtsB
MTPTAITISILTASLIGLIAAYIKAMGDSAPLKREIELLKKENVRLEAENQELKKKVDEPPACAISVEKSRGSG